ncbi:hypothetical protein ACFOWZ_41700 [Lentzea rhizosphaerae]|uniref:Holin-X, holin superfamily III n=1 Tax=Lentzea rhizosphaerae TaxID=2041025 RepID=A0ABV8C7G4_9PSEU
MTEVGTRVLDAAAVKAVATQLSDAIEKGRRQDRGLWRAVQNEVDRRTGFGPRYLPSSSALVILAVLVVGGTTGFLWAAASRNWVACALFVVLTTLGVFLLDQVRLMQLREDALKAGLYVSAVSAVDES